MLTNDSRLQVYKQSPWHVLASTGLTKKGVKRIISPSDGFIRWHLTIGLYAMLQAKQFPTCISNLGTSLTNVDRDTLTLQITDTKYN